MNQVRTFRAHDTRAALAAVRAAMGPDAMILSTQEVRGRLLRREIEITAAMPAPPVAPEPREADEAPSGPPLRGAAAYAAEAARRETVAPAPPPPFGDRREAATSTAPRLWADRRRFADEDLAGTQLRPERLAPEPAFPADPRENRAVLEDMEAMRREIRRLTAEARAGRDLELSPESSRLFARLVLRGMDEPQAEELVRQAELEASPAPLEHRVRSLLSERLVPDRAPWRRPARFIQNGQNVIALVGPTGVGKTTTIAKIAARALTESRLRVALITVDNYRVGAKEQLARYADIMDVPIHVARNGLELRRAIERCSSADLVLIDTAGRADDDEILEQTHLVRSAGRVLVHLVLSAATGARQLEATARRFLSVRPDRLIFSKLDETVGPGSILGAALTVARPISCITDGQRVPEDLHAVEHDALVNLITGP